MTATPERWEMSPERLARVLVPYRDNCKYLKRIAFEYLPASADVSPDQSEASLTAHGDLCIAESCYIDSTGHFNAVEFQICVNQLMYALGPSAPGCASCAPLRHWTWTDSTSASSPMCSSRT